MNDMFHMVKTEIWKLKRYHMIWAGVFLMLLSVVLTLFSTTALDGTVLPLINMRLKFGLPAIKQDADTRYLIINQQDEMIGFMIDKLTAAVRIPQSDIEPIPESFNENQNLLRGIGKREDRLITILRVENLLKRTF